MKIVFYSDILNQHQAPVSDELWEQTNHQFIFVELTNQPRENKGGTVDYSSRPYLLRAWESDNKRQEAYGLALKADCCVFAGINSLPFERARMKIKGLSFEMGERWLKHGLKSLASPRLLKWLVSYHFGGWSNKPLYKLCCSGFCAEDHYRLKSFKNKCYKWGYFTQVESSGCESHVEASTDVSTSEITPLMWCSRFLMLKHPELPILMAERLKKRGYKFHLDMYGTGEVEEMARLMVDGLGLRDVISFHGAVPNDQVHEAMRRAKIFLFTSDRYEGWGAVANESLSEGCALVSSDAIGSTPYLIADGFNGFKFKSSIDSCSFKNPDMEALDSLYDKVKWLLDHPRERKQMQQNAIQNMQETWSPKNAAHSLLQLINDLSNGKDTSIKDGPGSKA